MKILITGSTGFIGKNLVGKINKREHILAILVRDKNKAVNILGKKFNYIEFDERDLSYKEKIKDFNPEAVIHLASYLTSEFDTETLKKLLESNIKFGSLVLDALLGTDAKYFINTGSFSEYRSGAEILDGAYLYSATKIAFRYILDFYKKMIGFKVVNVIPYTIYGPNDTRKKIIDYIIDSIDTPVPIAMTGGCQVLDFVYISDAVEFYLNLIGKIHNIKEGYSEYHLGTGVGTSIRQVAALVEEITNKKTNINWGAKPYRTRDIMYAVGPISKAYKELQWKPSVSLKQGLIKMLNNTTKRSKNP